MNKIKILNIFLSDKRIILLIILNLLLFVFVVLEVSILDQGKVTRNIHEAKREASERAGRILRAERAESAQELKEAEARAKDLEGTKESIPYPSDCAPPTCVR